MKELPASHFKLSPLFKWVLASVVGLTAVSLGASLGLVMYFVNPPPAAERLIETCSTSWKLGFGTVIGLIGGKGLDVNQPRGK
jgi:hypothetical protein